MTESSSSEERFQNQTLRPILKFQNDLFLEVFKNYATKQKGVFFTLTPEKKMNYIENAIVITSYSIHYTKLYEL